MAVLSTITPLIQLRFPTYIDRHTCLLNRIPVSVFDMIVRNHTLKIFQSSKLTHRFLTNLIAGTEQIALICGLNKCLLRISCVKAWRKCGK